MRSLKLDNSTIFFGKFASPFSILLSLLQSIYKKRKFNEHEQLEKYSQLLQEDSEIDPIYWWKTHETIYPCLSTLAFDVLCIPARSVLSEQIFSKAGDIFTKRRNKLSDNSIV
jgi:hypothetical protein